MIEGQMFFYPKLVGIIMVIVFFISALHVIKKLGSNEYQDEKGSVMKVCPWAVCINLLIFAWFFLVLVNYAIAKEIKTEATVGNMEAVHSQNKNGSSTTCYAEMITDKNELYYIKLTMDDLAYLRSLPDNKKRFIINMRKGFIGTIVRSIEDDHKKIKFQDW